MKLDHFAKQYAEMQAHTRKMCEAAGINYDEVHEMSVSDEPMTFERIITASMKDGRTVRVGLMSSLTTLTL